MLTVKGVAVNGPADLAAAERRSARIIAGISIGVFFLPRRLE
jgi:hypothetical protein